MALDLDIDSAQLNARQLLETITSTAVKHNALYSDRFPTEFVLAGNKMVYFGQLSYMNGQQDVEVPHGITLAFSQAFQVTMFNACQPPNYLPLERILIGLKGTYLPMANVGIFPFGEQREREASQLGVTVITEDDWYEVSTPQAKRVRVFTEHAKFRAQEVGKSPDGGAIRIQRLE